MRENWLSYFTNSKEVLHFESVAIEVYDDIVKSVAEDESVVDFQDKRNILYREMEKLFDSTDDDFVIAVIGHSFKTGVYHLMNGLSGSGKLDIYKGNNGKRYREFSEKAIRSSLKLVEQLISGDAQFRLASSLVEVALACANKNEKEQIKKLLEEWISQIKFDGDEMLSVNKFGFLLPAINFLLEDKKYRTSEILAKIDEMIVFSVQEGDTAKSVRAQFNMMRFDCIFPQAFELKMMYYRKVNDKEGEKEVALRLAETYEELGDKRIRAKTANDLQVAIHHYEGAVQILQENGLMDKLERVKRILDEQKEKLLNMPNSNILTYDTDLSGSISDEEKEQLNKYLEQFNELDINGQICTLLSQFPLVTKLEIKERRVRNKQRNVLSEVFTVNITNEHNQTIFNTNTEEDKESYALFQYMQIALCAIDPFLRSVIKKENCIDFAEMLCGVEAITKRKGLFNKAFELFFMGDIYPALYILVPQIEYWFREEVYARGEQTSNLNYFPIEQARTLAPVFEAEELKEYLGEDIHWLFEQLMTKEPMNVRNKVAHGLELNDNGYCIYFVLAVLKLIMMKQTD